MGLFSRKKKIDAPPSLDVPSPVNINKGISEPDIPPIPSESYSNNSFENTINDNTMLDEAPMPTDIDDMDVPSPPKDTEELQSFPSEVDEDIPPSPPQEIKQEIPRMNDESTPMFPSMPEEDNFRGQDFGP